MERESLSSLILSNCVGKVPKELIPTIQASLETKNQAELSAILSRTAGFRNPTVSILLSIFIGGLGADRFYIGDIGLGILKLITGGGFCIWTIIDWFLMMRLTRERNFNALRAML